jgi:hypothetical protein
MLVTIFFKPPTHAHCMVRTNQSFKKQHYPTGPWLKELFLYISPKKFVFLQ